MSRPRLLFICLTLSLCSLSAQPYPSWQRAYFGVEGVWNALPNRWGGGAIQAHIGYQHTDLVGVGIGYGYYFPFGSFSRFIHGPSLHYRMAIRPFRVQAEVGWIADWVSKSTTSIMYRHVGKRDPFFRLSAAWQPFPLLVLGGMAVITPPLTIEQYRQDTGIVGFTSEQVFFIAQPFIGIQIPGRWKKWPFRRKRATTHQ